MCGSSVFVKGENDTFSSSDDSQLIKHYWYSETEAQQFRDANQKCDNDDDKVKQKTIEGQLFTNKNTMTTPPKGFNDYQRVLVSLEKPIETDKFW